jgi:signal recognition particle GTPase
VLEQRRGRLAIDFRLRAADGHYVWFLLKARPVVGADGEVVRVIGKVDPDAPHETWLVLDATVGRNALSQENIFGNTAGVTGIVMTKLDGTARGGVLLPVAQASDAPIKLIGVGEGIDDLQDFDAVSFARSLVGVQAAGSEKP